MQLRCSPREIEAGDPMALKNLRNQRQKIRSHHLGAGRPSIHMAMGTALVAAVPKIDLQRCELSALQWRENPLNDSHRHPTDNADSSRQQIGVELVLVDTINGSSLDQLRSPAEANIPLRRN